MQAAVGEVLAWRKMFWGLTTAMVANPDLGPNGTGLPNVDYGSAYRTLAPTAYPSITQLIEEVVASGLLSVHSSAVDVQVPALRPSLDTYLCGPNDYNAEHRVKLLNLLWDAIGTACGGRHERYERHDAGNHENIRMEMLFTAMANGTADACNGLAEHCMQEYDLEGWTVPDLINPTKVNIFQNRAKG